MPRIHKAEFARRRRALMAEIGHGGIALLPAAPVCLRNRDIEQPYRQDSDFQYLTGFPEPEALAVLIPGRAHGEYLLFCRERDLEMERWEGRRAGQEGALADYGADDAFPIGDLDDILPGLLEGRERVYYAMGAHPEFERQLLNWIELIRAKADQGASPPRELLALDTLLHDSRLYKSAAEVRLLKAAAELTCAAHLRAMQACRPGLREYHLEAELDYCFRQGGARLAAYGSIVAAGANACVMHYQANDAPLRDGDLVLIDAGCELECYASDVTRTFPVNGRFSPEQRQLYDIVLAANLAAIACVAPGRHWNEPHEATVRVITEGLLALGLLQGELDDLIETGACRQFYMHRAGHWLGLDVHDVGEYRIGDQWRMLEPGMALTVEPGLYIPVEAEVPRKWRGLGIRIEDEVLVTRSGCEVLTAGLPKAAAEIEGLMAAARDRRENAHATS